MECPDCGSEMVLRHGPHGRFYGCSAYPNCKGTVSCDREGNPTAIPGDAETRQARIEAHTGLQGKAAHIGRFNKKQCELVIEYAKLKLKGIG